MFVFSENARAHLRVVAALKLYIKLFGAKRVVPKEQKQRVLQDNTRSKQKESKKLLHITFPSGGKLVRGIISRFVNFCVF